MLTMTDFFCGGGGSSTGAKLVPGVTVRYAANHWPLAVKTHNINHPEADHDCADISQVEPRRYPRTDIAWFSPECTNHTQAKGKTRKNRILPADANGDTLPVDAEERSRATMWDVVRFTEHHRYRAVIVENVVEAAFWAPFQAWLSAMCSLGYEHQIVFMNSAHAQAGGDPVAQSRDRIYIVFTRAGDRKPDVEKWASPKGVCTACGHEGQLVRWWKPRTAAWPLEQWGRYKQQYLWHCANCAEVTEPSILPAYSIIDWSIPGQRIGDRRRPLADKTRARIEAGLAKYGSLALAVPLEGREGVGAKPVTSPFRCQTTRAQTGLAIPEPFVAELRGGGSKTRTVKSPFATVTASGNHHALVVPKGLVPAFMMRNNGSKGAGGEHCTPMTENARTITTKGHQSLVHWDAQLGYNRTAVMRPLSSPFMTMTTRDRAALLATAPSVDECYLRMLEVAEVRAATGLGEEYVLLGNKREQIKMCGNAVTPPAARDLVAAVVEALEGGLTLNKTLQLAA